jgi:uncharacterized protein YggE
MNIRLLFAGCLLLFVSSVSAQERSTPTIHPNTVYAGADGKFDSAPDTALVQFTISAQADTSKDAYDKASRAAERIRQILRSNGLDPKLAEVGFYSLNPVYDWRKPTRKLVAYQVSTNVSIKVKDFSKVGPLLQQFAEVEGNQNQSLSYTLENMDEAKQKAVQDALQRARASAQTLAQAGGRALGDLIYASVDTFEPVHPPVPMRMEMQTMRAADAAAPPTAEFSAQKVTVTAHVNALFGLK